MNTPRFELTSNGYKEIYENRETHYTFPEGYDNKVTIMHYLRINGVLEYINTKHWYEGIFKKAKAKHIELQPN